MLSAYIPIFLSFLKYGGFRWYVNLIVNFSFTQAAVKLRKSGGSVYERLFIVKKHNKLSSRKTPINNLSKF